jgi:peptidoglycan/LPS O-acetylase OafA/YrhL/lysophospholipase L1-like esterase
MKAMAEELVPASENAPLSGALDGPAANTRAMAKFRVPELDALRFLAAIGVVLYHFTYHHQIEGAGATAFPILERLSAFGYLGVNLFLMISGFVVLWSARDRRPGEFIVARVVRLYPEFWIAVILSSIAFTLLPGAHPRPTSVSMVIANLTMVPRLFHQENVDGVYWTLLLELKFYVLLWLLGWTRQLARVEAWLYGWLFISIGCFAWALPTKLGVWTMHPYAPLLIAGCLFFLVRAEGWSARRLAGLTACLGLALWHARGQLQSYVVPAAFTEAARLTAMAVVAACFGVFAFISSGKPLIRSTATVAFLGSLTYPLYLTHNIAKIVLTTLSGWNAYVALAGAALLAFGLAAGLGWLVDRHVRKPFARALRGLGETLRRATLLRERSLWLRRNGDGRSIRRRGLAIAAGLILGGAVASEVILRCAGFGHPLLLQADADIGYLFQAHQHLRRLGREIQINAFHQRTEEIAATPPLGARRMMVLGDSVTFGTTLLSQRETISERLKSELSPRMSDSLEVLNASAGSWGLGNELAYLRRFGTFGAQIVILQIGSHDLLQQKSTSARVGKDPSMPDRRPLTAIGEVWSRYVRPRWKGAVSSAYPSLPSGSAAATQFDANMRSLLAMIELIRRNGASPIVLHTPNRDEVTDTEAASVFAFTEWRSRFLSLLDEQRVPVIDLAKLWQGDPKSRSYYLDHVHLSAAGASAAANRLAKEIGSVREQASAEQKGPHPR